MGNDTDPNFIAHFVKGMKLVTQSLFMKGQQVEKLRLIARLEIKEQASKLVPVQMQRMNITRQLPCRSEWKGTERLEIDPSFSIFCFSIDDGSSSLDGSGTGRSSLPDLGARLEQQISILQKDVDNAAREYRDHLSEASECLTFWYLSLILYLCFLVFFLTISIP